MPIDEGTSDFAGADPQQLLVIYHRVKKLYDEVTLTLEAFRQSSSAPGGVAATRLLQTLLHKVSIELNECFRRQAAGVLSQTETLHWMPVVAALRANLRRASTSVSATPEEKLREAVHRLRASMDGLDRSAVPE
jgi:hypothetical protein